MTSARQHTNIASSMADDDPLVFSYSRWFPRTGSCHVVLFLGVSCAFVFPLAYDRIKSYFVLRHCVFVAGEAVGIISTC